MNDQPPPPPDDEPEIPPAPAWHEPGPADAPTPAEGADPSAGAGARRIVGLPVWAIGVVAAVVVIALVVVLVVSLSGGGDPEPAADAAPATPDTVTAPATTPGQTDRLEDLPTDEDFAASVARPMDLLGGSSTAVGSALAATSGPGDLARVNRVARRQGAVVSSARRQVGALPMPARIDHAQAVEVLTTATGHHRRYLDLLARSSAGTPSQAHLTALSRARASAAHALTAYRRFFALSPDVPDTITSAGFAATAPVASAIEASIAQREAARREAERRRNEGRGDVIPGDADGFQSPTGNIRCEYQGSQLFCSTSNDSFGVVLSESGPPVTARGTAAGGATLSYGSVWSRGAFSCQSLTNGLSCENSTSNGFFLSRESYDSW